MSIVVNEQMNVAELNQANALNGERKQEAVTKSIVAEAEVKKVSTEIDSSSPTGMGVSGDEVAANSPERPSGDRALSTEGGLAADVVLEGIGGASLKLVKTGYDMLSDMNPAGKHNNTMENLAAPKASASTSGKRVIFTGNQSSLSELFGSIKIAGTSLNGDSPIKGAKASEQSAKELQLKVHRDLGLVNDKQLGHGIQLKGQALGQEREMRMAGQTLGLGGATGNLNRPPTQVAQNAGMHLRNNPYESGPPAPKGDMLTESGET